jgi:hypothetical protein
MATKAAGTGFWGLVLLGVLVTSMAAVVLAAAAVGLALWLLVRHPFGVLAVAATAAAVVAVGPIAALALWSAVAAGALVWRARWRAGYERCVVRRWRRTCVYAWRWRRALAACDLAGRDRGASGRRPVPRLGSVRSSGRTDTVSVWPLDDQDVRCFAARADLLARELGAASCVVRTDVTGAIHLELVRRRRLGGRARPDGDLVEPRQARLASPGRPARCPHGTHRPVRPAA